MIFSYFNIYESLIALQKGIAIAINNVIAL